MGEEKADPGPGVSRRNPLSRYVRGRGRRETGLKQSRRCTAGDRVPGANQYQYQGALGDVRYLKGIVCVFFWGGNFLSHTTTGSTQQTNDRKRFRDVYQASPSHTRQSLAKKETPRGRGGSLSPPRSALSVGSLAR